jgi:hypothetical protein
VAALEAAVAIRVARQQLVAEAHQVKGLVVVVEISQQITELVVVVVPVALGKEDKMAKVAKLGLGYPVL